MGAKEFDCKPAAGNCGTTLTLPASGLAPSVDPYQITIRDSNGKDRGTAFLTITGKAEDRPGGPGSAKEEGKKKTCADIKCSKDQVCQAGQCVAKSQSSGQLCNPNENPKIIYRPEDFPGGKEQAAKIGGVMTAIGCVPTEPKMLINGIIRFSSFAGGGLAFLLMIFGAFQIITSAGNPDNVKKGQEQFTSAIIGLLFIIFSTLLLQIIGVDILQLPGLSK